MTDKADPFKHKQRWEQWKKKKEIALRNGKEPVSEINRKLIIEYLLDMEAGYNVAGNGKRSYIRLNSLRQRIVWILANMGIQDIRKATRREVLMFFNDMGSGEITKNNGKPYRSVVDYVKVFKAFWHWFQKKS